MFRAIIVDDESKVCELICMLGDWERLSIEVAATCHDGEEALLAIRQIHPDIVVTDIRMPVHDGLDLIRITRDMGLDTAFIIISGYRHFEYAHQAMQYGIVDYLLKPVNREELNHTLEKVCRNLNDLQNRTRENEQYHRMIEEKKTQLHKEFLRTLALEKPLPPDSQSCNDVYQTDFLYGCWQVLVINTSLPQLHIDNPSFASKVDALCAQAFPADTVSFTVSDPTGVFCFINYSPARAMSIPDDLSRLYHIIHGLTDIYGNFDLCVGAGQRAEAYEKLADSFQSAVSYARAAPVLGWNKVISYLPQQMADAPSSILTENDVKNLRICLDLLNTDGIRAWFSAWQGSVQKQAYVNPDSLYSARDLLFSLVPPSVPQEEKSGLLMRTDRARNTPDFIHMIGEMFLLFTSQKIREKSQAEFYPVRQAKQYIALHFAEPLTLDQLAGTVGLSPVYFSTLFKKETGQSFIDYLTEVRISEAKNLLRNPQLNINEISEMVGYNDNKYFRKLFKKHTGIKPSDYRKLYL